MDNQRHYDKEPYQLFQQHPYHKCGRRLGHKCKDPRCSIECRKNWGKAEKWFIDERINQIKSSHSIYCITLKIEKQLLISDHKQARKNILRCLKILDIQSHFVSEISPNQKTRLHQHGILYSINPVDINLLKTTIKQAVGEENNPVLKIENAKINIINKWTRYIHKAGYDAQPLMMARGTLSITTSSRGFFGISKGRFKTQVLSAWRLRKGFPIIPPKHHKANQSPLEPIAALPALPSPLEQPKPQPQPKPKPKRVKNICLDYLYLIEQYEQFNTATKPVKPFTFNIYTIGQLTETNRTQYNLLQDTS